MSKCYNQFILRETNINHRKNNACIPTRGGAFPAHQNGAVANFEVTNEKTGHGRGNKPIGKPYILLFLSVNFEGIVMMASQYTCTTVIQWYHRTTGINF